MTNNLLTVGKEKIEQGTGHDSINS